LADNLPKERRKRQVGVVPEAQKLVRKLLVLMR
jgi:hypothetical protein